MDSFGGVLSAYLRREGMTQADFLRATGIARQTLYEWLNDVKEPTEKKVRQCAEALGVSPVEFRYGPANVDSVVLAEVISKVEGALASLDLELPPAQKAKLIVGFYDQTAGQGIPVEDLGIERLMRAFAP